MATPEHPAGGRPVPPPHRIGTVGFLVGTAASVVVIGVLATFVTWRFHPAPKPPCVADCGPVTQAVSTGVALPEQRTYHSSKYDFEVDYSATWRLLQSGPDFVVFQTNRGDVLNLQSATGTPPQQLVLSVPSLLNASRFPDVSPDHEIRGARIGTVPGVGIVYAATVVPDSGAGRPRSCGSRRSRPPTTASASSPSASRPTTPTSRAACTPARGSTTR